MELNNLAAIVTGGASGLGEATARALAAAGANVAIFDLDATAGKSVAESIGGQFLPVDVMDHTQVVNGFAAARARHGQERILVNCAGSGRSHRIAARDEAGNAVPYPINDFRWVVQLNLVATFRCLSLSAAGMLALDPLESGERGVIVNTASIAAEDGQPGQAAYAASKAGVTGMTLPVARDLAGEGVRVNAILPGIFDTPLLRKAAGDAAPMMGRLVPFPPRLGAAEEFASLVIEMCRNSYFNAATVRLDGAYRMIPPPAA